MLPLYTDHYKVLWRETQRGPKEMFWKNQYCYSVKSIARKCNEKKPNTTYKI